MEKYSAFRDPGTGIQPFLTPIPPAASRDLLQRLFLPVLFAIGFLRTALAILLGILYLILVPGVCVVLTPIPILHRLLTRILTAVIARFVLLLAGYTWIPVVSAVSKRQGRAKKPSPKWNPGPGDLIVSNWVSWIEILWLAFRHDPIFVFPVCEPTAASLPSVASSSPGRRTGTGSAALSLPHRQPSASRRIIGFRRVSLISALRLTGHTPSYSWNSSSRPATLEALCRTAARPVVLFPECTTSNGRGLLRFADMSGDNAVPVALKVFFMCVRYDPPEVFKSSPTHPIPSLSFNPLPHFFQLTTNLANPRLSIRLLPPDESLATRGESLDRLTVKEMQATFVAVIESIGNIPRLAMGWEDKAAFLDLYKDKR